MSDQLLINVLLVGPIEPGVGGQVTVAHGLRSNGEPVVPRLIQPDRATPIVVVSADELTATLRNDGSIAAEAYFRFERGLSVEVDAETMMDSYWQGVVAGGGGGGVTAVTATAPITATGFPVTDIALDTTSNLVVTIGGDLDLSDTGVVADTYGDVTDPLLPESLSPVFTVDAKGRITSASEGPIQIGGMDAKAYVDSVAGGSTLVAQTYFVTTGGNDTTGDGSLTKPFASIQRAITAANTQPVGTKVRIDVAPGTYATGTKITLGRYNTFIQGAGDRPEEQVTLIRDPIEIDCSTATSVNNQQVSIDGCFVEPSGSFTEPAVGVIGTGQFTVVVTNSYLTTTNAAAGASAFSVANPNVRTVLWSGIATVQAAAAAAPVLKYAGGNHRLSDFQVLHGGSVGAAAASNGIAVSGLSYLFADRVLVETVTNQPAITLAGTAYGANTSKAALSNIGITTTGVTSDGISHTATGLVVLVTDAFFTVPSARTCIIGAALCPTAIGQLSFAPSASATISIALPAYNSEIHGAMFLPSVASASAPLKVDANRKVVTGTIGPTEGGTGLISYVAGDLIYASAANTLAQRNIGTSGQALVVSGGFPTWTSISGILAYTGNTFGNFQGLRGDSSTSSIPLQPYTGNNILTFQMDSVSSASVGNALYLRSGNNTGSGQAGFLNLFAGNSTGGNGGTVNITGGNAATSGQVPGNVKLFSGTNTATSTKGNVSIDGNDFPNTTLATGDMLYASASGVLSARTIGSTGDVLTVNGSGLPVWSPPAAAPSGLVGVPTGSSTFTNGKAVAINSLGALALASATDLSAAPAVGLYVAGSTAYIRVAGVMSGLSGLVAGTAYYLSTTAGELTSTPPSTTGNVVQYIGRATSTTELFVSPATIVIA